jgi:protein-S-isoprenylcysteine O-methyltransferase Ste14
VVSTEVRVPHRAGLFWRASIAFLALPVVVGVLVPWLLRPRGVPFHIVALPILAVGAVLLVWCVRDFYVAGQGTLAPWNPPRALVTIGLYRYSRNPMYLAVLLILCGWAVAFPSSILWTYTAIIAIAFHLRVVLYEEPWLARTHGPAWDTFRAAVPRWLGRHVRAGGRFRS